VAITPPSTDYIGPIDFNEAVIPDLTQPDTSVDGGVALVYAGVEYVTRSS
jgi:hypothetical protein